MASKNNPKGRENDIVLQQLKDEVLIYDLTINKAYCLNETSALVWNLCDGSNSAADISKKLSKELKRPVTDDLVWFAIDQFKKNNLLSNSKDLEIEFDGLSRRDVVKRIGLGTMVALPIIMGITAPLAVHANSACVTSPVGTCTCDANGVAGICSTSGAGGVACTDTNCRCNKTNGGNDRTGTCVP